mgnify:CR=1 FL=1
MALIRFRIGKEELTQPTNLQKWVYHSRRPSMQFKNFAIGAINSRTKSKKNLIISCFVPSSLTLSGTGEGIFILLNLLYQILLADFFSKFPNFLGGENWDQSGYFDTLPSSLSLTKIAPCTALRGGTKAVFRKCGFDIHQLQFDLEWLFWK